MNTCFQSDCNAPVSLPAIGTFGEYILPAIIIDGKILAIEQRIPVEMIGHIGAFGIRLRELRRPNLEIETHFTSFETAAGIVDRIARERSGVEHWSAADEARYDAAKNLMQGNI